MEQKDIQYFKEKLETEKNEIQNQLATVATPNLDVKGDWVPTEGEDESSADENDRADAQREFATNTNISEQLELRLKEVLAALEKMTAGTYGLCEISGEMIERDRLEANPAARTCKAHINE